MSTRVLVLEDDPFTRLSLVGAMKHFGFDVVVEEDVPGRAAERARAAKPDVAILDLHLGKGATGADVAKELRKQNSRIGIVMLTSYDDPRLLAKSLPALPDGTVYLTKGKVENFRELRSAVEEALAPEKRQQGRVQNPVVSALSDSQVETMRLVAEGYSNAEIARRRNIRERSVEVTIARIAKAVGIEQNPAINQRVQLAKFYYRSAGAKETGE